MMKPDKRVGFNVRKRQILKLLDGREMMPREVAAEMRITEGAARFLMRRYQVSGLLSRSEVRGSRGRNPYLYTLSNQGRKVLDKIKERPRKIFF